MDPKVFLSNVPPEFQGLVDIAKRYFYDNVDKWGTLFYDENDPLLVAIAKEVETELEDEVERFERTLNN